MYEHQTHKLHSDLLIKISKYIIHKLGYVWLCLICWWKSIKVNLKINKFNIMFNFYLKVCLRLEFSLKIIRILLPKSLREITI